MKKISQKLLITLAVTLLLPATLQAQTNLFVNSMEVLESASMEVQHSELSYDNVEEAFLELLANKNHQNSEPGEIHIQLHAEHSSQKLRFIVEEEALMDGCGSLHYYAVEYIDSGIDYLDDLEPARKVELVDHRQRRCRDLRRFDWELSLVEDGSGQNPVLPELVLAGNPQ